MPKNYQKYANELLDSAKESGYDASSALVRFLDYLLDVFDYSKCPTSEEKLVQFIYDAHKANHGFFLLMMSWLEEVDAAMQKHRSIDFFGSMYEALFQGRGKASALGQFFTPSSLCTLMADLTVGEQPFIANDPACGSGRTLLGAFEASDWSKPNYYTAEDIDSVSCKMCALNMMAHGMRGEVRQMDTLMNSKPAVTYYINEIRYPFPIPFYSIRREFG